MYATHQPLIAHYAASSPQALSDVLIFVQATINQHFYRVPTIVEDIRERGIESRFLNRVKKASLTHIKAHERELHQLFCTSVGCDADALVKHIVEYPGFGIVKAGFVVQLVVGMSGCLDVHNLRRLGLNKNAFRIDSCSTEALTTRVKLYNSICHDIGTGTLWDDWCTLVAGLYPTWFNSPEHVSQLHVDCIIRP